MNQQNSLLRRAAHLTVGITALTACFHSLAMALHFDRTVGYLDANIFSTLLYIVFAALFCGCITLALRLKKQDDPSTTTTPNWQATSLFTGIAAPIAALLFAGAMVWECLGTQTQDTPSLLRALSAGIATVYFATPAPKRVVPMGIATHVYFVFSVATEYFDWTVPMNSPLKLMQQSALLAAMLFMLAEMNVHANTARPRRRLIVFSILGAVFGISNGISMTVALLSGGIVPTAYWVRSLPTLGIGLFALARLYSVAFADDIPTNPVPCQTANADIPADAAPVQDIPTTSEEEE